MERRQFLIGASTILTSAFVAKAEWFLEKEKAVVPLIKETSHTDVIYVVKNDFDYELRLNNPEIEGLTSLEVNDSGEIILATDADCRIGALWIASMAYSLMNKNGIIIGYSEISDIKKSYFEKYQKLDFLAILIANAGASGWNQYWSGTGQNPSIAHLPAPPSG